ncbi:protein OXIDATIVE STRESS 3 LIKE 1-like [Phragmites australis]|uniref:protein OXIDATIVE STRESS 3 LIKE 1-like n=1 Tax=Phragmites australis TaxID=29695 RepID=UPI002D76F651|nr:protein OXIDATIVE STRESS 3 LIKE 1-like [Phragmites australis]
MRRPMPKLARDQSKGEETSPKRKSEQETAAFSWASTGGGWERVVQVCLATEMSCRRGEEGNEELFETMSSVSGGESDADGEDHFPDGAGEGTCDQDSRLFVPQPLRGMNSDSIYDMSSMMSQLPGKKGLSRYYEGRSQSFACLEEVRCLEDLRKKDSPYKQKIKSCKSYVALGGMAKKTSSSSCANLNLVAAKGFRPPPIQNGYHQ